MKKIVLFLLVFFSYSVNAQIVPSFLGVYDKKNPNSTGTVTFTNCSSTGKSGPSQSDCNTSYSGTSLEGDVTLSSGIQLWTVPTTATYTIEVWGAKGGYEGGCHSNGVGSSNCHGANGARMKGEFNLTSGDILRIAVGQRGESYILSSTQGGGGGAGGSFVAKGNDHSSATKLIIAGGGGGGHYYSGSNPIPGQITEAGLGNSSTGSGYGAAGGGSWSSDGADGTYNSKGGKGWANLLVGGDRTPDGSSNSHWSRGDGGFGGGGGGSWAAGPGGGYNGGPLVTSYGNLTPGGSGGGSYNGGANQDNSIGVGDSNGKVIITW